MDAVELHDRCVEQFRRGVRAVSTERWSARTPCPDWTVRQLVNHLVYEERWAVPLMAGATIQEVGDRFEGDLLGDDPVGTVEHAARAAQAAVVEPVLAGRTVHLSAGQTPAEEYTRQLAADHLIHSWDLAVAIGADPALPAELVDEVARWFAGREQGYRVGGWIGERPRDPGDDPQAALLLAFGRDPAWTQALAAVTAFNAAFSAGHVDSIMALMTDDCVFESTGPPPDGERHVGARAVRQVWEDLFRNTPQPRFEWEDVHVHGDRGVVRWRFSWTGGHIRGVDVLTIRGDKVAEKLSYVKG
jgi:uncharacterized protein (TIGR03086 family)